MTAQERLAQDATKSNYQPTERELAALKRFRQKPPKDAPRIKVLSCPVGATTMLDHPEWEIGEMLFMEAIGTSDPAFCRGLLTQLNIAIAEGHNKSDDINFMASVIIGIAPRDQIETMLAAQMAFVHMATARAMRQFLEAAERADRIQVLDAFERSRPKQSSAVGERQTSDVGESQTSETAARLQMEMAERSLNRLTRTFTAQMEALKRYRIGCEQKVTFENMMVAAGDQAVVGNMAQDKSNVARIKPEHPPAVASKPKDVPMPPNRRRRDRITQAPRALRSK